MLGIPTLRRKTTGAARDARCPQPFPALVRTRVRAAVRRPARLTPEEPGPDAALRLCSLLLQYPDAELHRRPAGLTAAAGPLPAIARRGATWPPSPTGSPHRTREALERHYVEMFDLRRKSSLYLTYYLHGDTRRRGMALLTLNQRYRAAGWDTDGELPDHLPVVLEFAALAGPGGGEAPLRQHRRGSS